MDDAIMSLILKGCKMAKDLELNLHAIADQPEIVSKSCEEIMKVFGDARERLNVREGGLSMAEGSRSTQMVDASLQEWLARIFTQRAAPSRQETGGFEFQGIGSEMMGQGGELGVRGGGSSEISDAARESSSSSQRTRRRKEDDDRRIVRVPVPMMGNTDLPPEDGFTWRKYGQKEILGSRFPRAYYRCTHQKLYQCPAKKQVQRLDHDPFMLEVTYRGDHTCHMSSTAPSAAPPQMGEIGGEMSQPMSIHSLSSTWISTEFTLGSGGPRSGPGPSSTSRYGREFDYPVADLADAMFNSGSSSSNVSMDLIFPSVEEKWESGEKKN